MFTVNEFFNGKWIGMWEVASEEEAREIISSLKVGIQTKSYNIESSDGVVIDVFKALNAI